MADNRAAFAGHPRFSNRANLEALSAMPPASPTQPGPAIDYLAPEIPQGTTWHEVPLVAATDDSLAGYGQLVDDYRSFPLEICTWPATGWRPVDSGTGNEAGTVQGTFQVWWEGDLLFGRNEAVKGHYLFGWSKDPRQASSAAEPADRRERVLLWHANYHPDGGQLFFPLDGQSFVTALALPGDDITPGKFVAFQVPAGRGLYIHPGVWHEAVVPLGERGRFHDEQGRVHARVSCQFAKESGVLLSVPLPRE